MHFVPAQTITKDIHWQILAIFLEKSSEKLPLNLLDASKGQTQKATIETDFYSNITIFLGSQINSHPMRSDAD